MMHPLAVQYRWCILKRLACQNGKDLDLSWPSCGVISHLGEIMVSS